MKTAVVHLALLPFLCGSLVDAGLFEQLTAIGVWATRPHFPQRSVGDPPTFSAKKGDPPTFSAKECGRPAHIHSATRPHSSCVPAKKSESPSLILCTDKGGRVALPPLATYQQRCFFKRCSVKTADVLREADEKRGPITT